MTNLEILNCNNLQSSSWTVWRDLIPWIVSILLAIFNFIQLRRIESLKGDLQKKVHVHRLQFEKEFEVYKEVWAQIYVVKKRIKLLRPEMDYHEPDKEKDEIRKKERFDDAIAEGIKLIQTTESNRPFYAENIYKQLVEINKLVSTEIIEAKLGDRREPYYWNAGKVSIETYANLSDRISTLIRERIGNMNEI